MQTRNENLNKGLNGDVAPQQTQKIGKVPFPLNWEILCARAEAQKELLESQKKDAARAFGVLSRLFGNSFFDQNHSLYWFFLDRSAWRSEWAIWLANLLESISHLSEFHLLIRDLKNPELFGERMTVLRIIEILKDGGFSFALDKPIKIEDKIKKPDLFVESRLPGNGFYVEVSTLSPHQKQYEADRIFRELWDDQMLFSEAGQCGQLLRIPAPLHLIEIKNRVKTAIRKANESTGFETVEEAGVFQFGFACNAKDERLQDWSKAHGIEIGQFLGPSIDVSEFERIAGKLKDKREQLPEDSANVVVIYSHLFARPPSDVKSFQTFAHEIGEVIYRFPRLSYLIVIFSWIGGIKNEVLKYQQHICVNRCRLHFNCESTMLFKNRFSKNPLLEVDEYVLIAALERLAMSAEK